MTKTKIAALLSVLALLASLPLTVALAQGAPYLVIGTAMVDDEPAMMGTMVVAMVGDEKVGSGEVFDAMGHYRLLIGDGNPGDTVMISLMMGEGDEMMEYMASTDGDVMIGASGESKMADLMAYSGEQPAPTAMPRPTKTAEQMIDERVRSAVAAAARNIEVPAGEPGPAGADGADGDDGRGGARPARAAPPERTALTALTEPTAPMVPTAPTVPTALTDLTDLTALAVLPAPLVQTAPPAPPVLPAQPVQTAAAESSP